MREAVHDALKKYLRYTKTSGPNNIGGPCPFHKGGQEKRPSFYMHVETGVFYCHTCHAKGTFVQFLRRMGASAKEVDVHFAVAEKAPKKRRNPLKKAAGVGDHFLNEALLGIFEFCPKSLVAEGFDPKLLKRMEIGFDKANMRITFPIRDINGRLVGLSGRTVRTDPDERRYQVYKSEDLLPFAGDDPDTLAQYRAYDIKNHDFLWNMHNVYPKAFYGDTDTVIIVEGYKACLWLLQQDIENVVALQGSRMTATQERILSRLGVTYILLLDANKAGREGTYDTARRLQKRGLRVLCCDYSEWAEESTQPDDLDNEELLSVLDDALPFSKWRKKRWNIHLDVAYRNSRSTARTRAAGRRRGTAAEG